MLEGLKSDNSSKRANVAIVLDRLDLKDEGNKRSRKNV